MFFIFCSVLTVFIGDQVHLICPPGSFSNLIRVVSTIVAQVGTSYSKCSYVQDERQYQACNVGASNTMAEFRGFCFGRSKPLILIISDTKFGYGTGNIIYLTSKLTTQGCNYH